jgi:hypothetical protein
MIRIFGEDLEVPMAKARRKNIEQAISWLRSRNLSPHTIQFYIVATKRFYKFLRYENTDIETPYLEEVRWLKSTRKENEFRQPTSDECKVFFVLHASGPFCGSLASGRTAICLPYLGCYQLSFFCGRSRRISNLRCRHTAFLPPLPFCQSRNPS